MSNLISADYDFNQKQIVDSALRAQRQNYNLSRRRVGQNLTAETSLFALVAAASGGTIVTSGASEPQSVTANCTSTTCRLGMAKNINYDVSKYYEYSIEVEDFFFTNKSIISGQIMGVGFTPAAGTQYYTGAAANLVKGQRLAIRYQPGGAADYLRAGININASLPCTPGDFIKFTRPALYEVDSLVGDPIPYTYSRYGVLGSMSVGVAPYQDYHTIGSCVLCCGDSWFDFTTDPPALLGANYGREVIISATGGYTLANISTALATLLATGTAALNPSYNHVPGICVIEGGINDLTADASGRTLFTRLQSILAQLAPRNIVPIIVLPTLPTDSTFNTAGRRTAIDLYRKLVLETGIDYIDGPLYFCNADGTANTTYMTDDAGAHLHLLTAGITLLTRLIDEKIRVVEAKYTSSVIRPTW